MAHAYEPSTHRQKTWGLTFESGIDRTDHDDAFHVAECGNFHQGMLEREFIGECNGNPQVFLFPFDRVSGYDDGQNSPNM